MSDMGGQGDRRVSRRKGTLALIASSYVLLGLVFIQGVVLVPWYLRQIGVSLYGAWLATGSILSYMALCDFGLNSVLIQKVGEAYGAKDMALLKRTIGSGLCVALALAIIPAVGGLALAGQIHRVVPVPAGEVGVLSLSFRLAAIAASMMLAVHALGGVITALQAQLPHGLIQVGSHLCGIVTIVILLLRGGGLLSLAIGMIVHSATALACETLLLRGLLRRRVLPGERCAVDWATVKSLAKPAVMIFAARGGSVLGAQSDNLIVGMLLGSRAVVAYAMTKRAFDFLVMVVGHFVGAFVPALAHFFGEMGADLGRARPLTNRLVMVTGMLGMVTMGGYLVLDQAFVGLWVGPSQFAGRLLVFILGLYGVLHLITFALYNVVLARGRIARVAIATSCETLVRIPLAFLLVWLFALPGLAMAAMAGLLAGSFWILAVSYRKEFAVRADGILRGAVEMGKVLIGIVGAGILCGLLPEARSWPLLAAYGILYLAVCLEWTLAVNKDIRKAVLSRIRTTVGATGA